MGTFWHKPGYTAADRDETGEIRADALRPGIYCEDQAALDQLRRGARVRSREFTPTPFGWLLDGQDVFLCTPEQAEAFRATATKGPPPASEPVWVAGIASDAKAFVARLEGQRASPSTDRVTRQQRRAAERAAAAQARRGS